MLRASCIFVIVSSMPALAGDPVSTPVNTVKVDVGDLFPSNVQMHAIGGVKLCRAGQSEQSGTATVRMKNSGLTAVRIDVLVDTTSADGTTFVFRAAPATMPPLSTQPVVLSAAYCSPSAGWTDVFRPSVTYPVQVRMVVSESNVQNCPGKTSCADLFFKPLVIQTEPPLALVHWLLWPALAAAVLVTFLTGVRPAGKSRRAWWNQSIGELSFNKVQSWGSTLTFAAAIITGFLTLTNFPGAASHLSKNTYATVSTLFAGLILLAPMAYNSVRVPVKVPVPDPEDPDNKTGLAWNGFLLAYLAAATINVWAILGQICLIVVLLDELQLARFLPAAVVRVLQVVMCCGFVLILVYSARTVRVLTAASNAHTEKKSSVAETAAPPPRAPRWSLM